MQESSVVAILLFGTTVGSLTLVRALKSAKCSGDWNTTAMFVLAAGWLVNLSGLTIFWEGGRSTTSDSIGNTVTLHTASDSHMRILRWVVAAVVVFGLTMILLRRLARGKSRLRAVTVIGLSLNILVVFTTALNHGQFISAPQIVLAAAVMACALLDGGRGAYVGAAIFGSTLAIVSGLAAAVRYNLAVSPCRIDKCGPLGVLFHGVMSHENALGIALVLALPFVYLGFRGRPRIILTLYVAAMAWMTGSRTAVIGLMATLFVLLALRPSLDRPANPGRRLIGWCVVVAGFVVGVVLPELNADPQRYTGRGYMWGVALEHLGDSPFFGLGESAWSGLSSEHINPLSYSAHNQWLDTRFIAGWLGFALLVGIIVAILRAAGMKYRLAVLAVITAPIYIGITERPWSIVGIDPMSFSLLAAILSAPVQEAARAGGVMPADFPEQNAITAASELAWNEGRWSLARYLERGRAL